MLNQPFQSPVHTSPHLLEHPNEITSRTLRQSIFIPKAMVAITTRSVYLILDSLMCAMCIHIR